MQVFEGTKDKIAKVQTLFFPLKYIGDAKNGFKGAIANLKVYNKVIDDEVIKNGL